MLTGNVSSASLTATVFNPVLASRPAPAPATGVASSPATDGSAPRTTPSGGGVNSVPSSASISLAEESVIAYSAKVAGKQYVGSVEESDGEYTASVPSLARATASASSEQEAENDLYERINELV
jgi:hypothetical protein